MTRTVLVVPTYNEAANIERLLDTLVYDQQYWVLVVDDNSPDGTAAKVEPYVKNYRRVHLLSGEKRGLGAAYKRGMAYALEQLKADIVIEMDADHSHDPSDLPRLIAALKDADIAIGSRYVTGGATPGWSTRRRLLSQAGNLLARSLTGLWRVHDTTAGYRAIRASVLRGMDWDSIPADGYGFQIALLHRLKEGGARITEVPVTFRDRTAGETKLRWPDLTEFFGLAFKLGWATYGRLTRFLIVGASGLAVNYAVFALLGLTGIAAYWFAIALATETSILWNFAWHERWTFADRRHGRVADRLGKYHLTSLGGIIVTYLAFYALLAPLGASAGYGAALVLATAWNYFMSNRWAWR